MADGNSYRHNYLCTVLPWKYADGFRGGVRWRNYMSFDLRHLSCRPIDSCYPILSHTYYNEIVTEKLMQMNESPSVCPLSIFTAILVAISIKPN